MNFKLKIFAGRKYLTGGRHRDHLPFRDLGRTAAGISTAENALTVHCWLPGLFSTNHGSGRRGIFRLSISGSGTLLADQCNSGNQILPVSTAQAIFRLLSWRRIDRYGGAGKITANNENKIRPYPLSPSQKDNRAAIFFFFQNAQSILY